MSPYVSNTPADGDAVSIGNWLELAGSRKNIVVPGI